MRPILKIELPKGTTQEHFDKVWEKLCESSATFDYHVIVLYGSTEFSNVEIITASDISLHFKPSPNED